MSVSRLPIVIDKVLWGAARYHQEQARIAGCHWLPNRFTGHNETWPITNPEQHGDSILT